MDGNKYPIKGISASKANHRLVDHQRSGTFGKEAMMESRLGGNSGNYNIAFVWTGEKNLGEMGPIRDYRIDYARLRARSWQLYLESEIAQTVLGKFITWMIGKGLKIQVEPEKDVLESEGVNGDLKEFIKKAESRFRLYSSSIVSDYSGMINANIAQADAFKNAKIGGDVLVILRYGLDVNIQLIDGQHIISPFGFGNEIFPNVLKNGNRVENGIELDEKNQHVAYYVRKAGFGIEFERIEARDPETGLIMAYMVYGSKYRLDNHRGLPLLSVMFETAKKLERYKEATVGSAEERQKIAYFIEHTLGSTGENPLLGQTALARDAYNIGNTFLGENGLPTTIQGEQLANRVAASTNKQTFNMPINSTIKSPDSKNELYFKDFYGTNIDLLCAAAQIPPEVAMSKYNSNFSASRAALKDWENTLNVGRDNFAFQFIRPIYSLWLHVQILRFKISAPGYLEAFFITKNYMVVEAYRKARYVGAAIPHIDPQKEVEAERAKLGPAGANIPLTTAEQATENLSGGDVEENMIQFAGELERNNALGIVVVPDPIAKDPNFKAQQDQSGN